MAVCSFFLRGQCKFGNQCRNEHPKDRGPAFGNTTWSSAGNKTNVVEYAYTSDSMSKDFTPGSDKPMWSLSSYGPAKYEPNLVSGLDESFEELRTKAILALRNNVGHEYVAYETEKTMAADNIYSSARDNVPSAYEQAIQNTRTADSQSTSSVFRSGGESTFSVNTKPSTFGGRSTVGNQFESKTNTSAFGQPSGFGALANTNVASPFGGGPSPGFGQPAGSAFGSQPSANPAFGQSSLIKPATAFGTSATGTGNSFVSGSGGGGFSAFAGQQPSAFGLAAANNTGGGSVFGQTATPVTSGATSVFGAPAQGTSAFGTPAQGTSNPGSVFGIPAQGTTTSAFGAPTAGSAFGSGVMTSNPQPQGNQPSTFSGAPSASGFGVGGTVGSASSATSGFSALLRQPSMSDFGGTTTNESAFGAPKSVFGNTNGNSGSAFGAPSSSNSPFSQGQPSPFGHSSNTTSAFGAQAVTSAFGGKGPFSGMSDQTALSKPKSGPPDFQNAPSKYKPGRNKYDALLPDDYIDLLPESAREAFAAKNFEWRKVPEWIPPLSLR